MNNLNNEEKPQVNQMGNKQLKDYLADNAVTVLLNSNLITSNELVGITVQFAYVLSIENHGLEALFKILVRDKTFYFTAQSQSLKMLNISELQYEMTANYMITTWLRTNTERENF